MVLERLERERREIKERQGGNTYGKCLAKFGELIKLKNDIDQHNKAMAKMHILYNSLIELETDIGFKIRTHIQKVIDTLKERVNILYLAVHPEESKTPTIRLDLSTDTKQPQLNLLTNFSPNRQGVVPSGYLSDSQVHTLALSLRLAAILVLNKEVPIIVLDDVVTSYDADHRKSIAAMLADHFKGFQIILVTHDERFFNYLQDHLPTSWVFKRIITIEKDYGPRFHDHKVLDEVIEERTGKREISSK